MAVKEEFKKFYSRYLLKFYLKNGLLSLLISLSVLLVMSLSFRIVGSKLYWISFIVFPIVFATSFLILYLIRKPSEKEFYESLEDLDLEQRAITMYEFKDDDSLIAKVQREDTSAKINSRATKAFKLTMPFALIIATIVVARVTIVTSVVSVLSAYRIIPSATQIIDDVIEVIEAKEYEVVFEVEGDGYIDGDIIQLVKEGGDATAVTAVPEEGWYFYSWGKYDERYGRIMTDDMGWSDDAHDPFKEVKNVDDNVIFYAVFKEITDQNNSNEDDDFLEDNAENLPQEPIGQQQSSGSDDGVGGGEGGGKHEANNQVIDGETYYGDSTYDNAYADAMEQMGEDDGMSDEKKKIIEDYFETIEK